MKTKIKRTKSKDQCRKEKKNMKKNKTPNITNKSTNSNKNCKNIKSKKSNDSNKDKKTRASTSEASPPSSQHGRSAAWRRRTQAPPPCWTCCGHVQDHMIMMLMSAPRCTWSPGAIISRQMGHFGSSSSSSSLYTMCTLLFSAWAPV